MIYSKHNDPEQWVGELDVLFGKIRLFSLHDYDNLRRLLDGAPEGARQTSDYWYARGIADAEQLGLYPPT